jgi:ATP-dependent DNA helicase DinG
MKNAFISLPSPFPVEHRLVYFWRAINWPRHDQDQSVVALDLAGSVERILSMHPAQHGLIHTVSYSRATLLLEHCTNERLYTHTDQGFDLAVERLQPADDRVLVSPRALEGVDLPGERSRFQIFIKLPHLFLGDERTRRRKDSIKNWYALQTALNLVQGCGRSVRNSSDIAPTYILDASFGNWLALARSARLLPAYFLEALSAQLTRNRAHE